MWLCVYVKDELGSKGKSFVRSRILTYSQTFRDVPTAHFPTLQALVINGITYGIKSLTVGDPVGRGRKTKRDRETEGGARVAGILMAPACQVRS